MDSKIKLEFDKSKSGDKTERYEAYHNILKITDQKVDWAYEIWDQLVEDLTHKDNHQRSRAAQYLANLAISDSEMRMMKDFSKLWEVTYDEKFVTARHSLQSIWKVGIAGTPQKEMVMDYMVQRFKKGTDEKNFTLIRNDILQNMRNLYDHFNEESIKQTALDLIDMVEDKKYTKKYIDIFK
jgi:HEAT repeat protein